jgi:hypothetical protein
VCGQTLRRTLNRVINYNSLEIMGMKTCLANIQEWDHCSWPCCTFGSGSGRRTEALWLRARWWGHCLDLMERKYNTLSKTASSGASQFVNFIRYYQHHQFKQNENFGSCRRRVRDDSCIQNFVRNIKDMVSRHKTFIIANPTEATRFGWTKQASSGRMYQKM